VSDDETKAMRRPAATALCREADATFRARLAQVERLLDAAAALLSSPVSSLRAVRSDQDPP
jgi:hypothetical protein